MQAPSPDIAMAVERGITSQAQLVTSLSLALIAGLLAVLLQSRIHNATNPEHKVELRNFPLLVLSVTAAGLAIALGYVIAGMLIQFAPQLFSHSFEVSKRFTEQNFSSAPIGSLQTISLLQFLVFLAAVVLGAVFVVRNRR